MANWQAVIEAVRARGPRCDHCGNWTFRPKYLDLPRYVARLCPACFPFPPRFLEGGGEEWDVLAMTQVFRSHLNRRTKYPIDLVGKPEG